MSQASQSDDEEVELSALEYARANALSRDYLKEELGLTDLSQLRSNVDGILTDASKLPQFDLGSPPKLEERLIVSKDAAFLLQSVIREESQDDIDNITSSLFNSTRHPARKLELPLLRSDHDTDCRLFASREGIDIKLEDVRLPLEMVDDEKNEGFVYPQKFWDIGPELLQKLKSEKLGASKQTLMYLTACMRPIWTEDDATELWDSEVKYKRVGIIPDYVAEAEIQHRILLLNLLHLQYRQHSSRCSSLTNLLPTIQHITSLSSLVLYRRPNNCWKRSKRRYSSKTSRHPYEMPEPRKPTMTPQKPCQATLPSSLATSIHLLHQWRILHLH